MKATYNEVSSKFAYTIGVLDLKGLKLVHDTRDGNSIYWLDHESHLLPSGYTMIKSGKEMMTYLDGMLDGPMLASICK